MEIESKFGVSDRQIFTELLHLPALGEFTLLPHASIERQHNTYFDTPDRRLTAAEYSLRVRDLGDQRIATLKHTLYNVGVIRAREEWETFIGADDHPLFWPASEVRSRVLGLIGVDELEPLFTILTRRQYIYAARGEKQFAELSLDEGAIMAGGRVVGFRELEIELKAADRHADFEALIELLRERFALTPEPRSKKARGMALLDRATNRPQTLAMRG